MELTYDEVESLIIKISTGKDFHIGDDYTILNYPDNCILQVSDMMYKKYYDEAIDKGLFPIKELEEILLRRGIFTDDDKKEIENLKSQLHAQNVLLSKTLKVKANQTKIKKVINDLQNKIDTILYKKHSKLVMSAESKASEYKSRYMCWRCTTDFNSKLLWEDFDDYMEDPRIEFKSELLSKFIKLLNGIDLQVVRYIARSTMWRIRYIASMKTSDKLFGRPSSEYTTDQLNLAYWSNFYDQVYSMMPDDRPTDEVIEDDTLLDTYMNDYYKEMHNDAAERRSNKSKKGMMSAFDSQEVIVTQSHDLYEEIEYDKPIEAQRVKELSDVDGTKKQKLKRRKNG